MEKSVNPWTLPLWAVTTVGMFVAIWSVFVHAPEERVMGAAQKIFYFHVPSAMVTYSSVAVLLTGSLGYLWTRDRRWDSLSRSATEVGLVFCTLVLITGPIWARPAPSPTRWSCGWGSTRDVRLTTSTSSRIRRRRETSGGGR